MGAAFTSFFAMIASFFRAGERLGRATENLAGWADDASGVFADQAKQDRDIAVLKATKARALLQAELNSVA